jgi:hypothetical protein
VLLALPVPVGEGRVKGSGMAGVPSQREGTGQEKKEKAGRPGFPRNWRERARTKRGKAGKPGFPRNARERARNKGRKQESRGSLAMGGNGPGRKEKAGCRLGRKRSRSRCWT